MPEKENKLQRKRFCLTWNNYGEDTVENLKGLFNDGMMRYIIVGKEIAPSSGTPHLQIYLETKKKVTIAGLKKLLNSTVPHIEVANGDAESNKTYCSKEEVVLELGSPVKERQRTDLDEVKADIDNGLGYEGLWDKHFSIMLQYRRGLEEYANLKRLRRADMPKVYVWWGATGTGKTRGAFELARSDYDDDFWVWPGGNWFDGYRGQRVAIFDEFHGGEEQGIAFSMWKKLCDRYSLTVPVKGGFTNWNPEVIIFTSNVNPVNWWPTGERKPADWHSQFDRRLAENKEFS